MLDSTQAQRLASPEEVAQHLGVGTQKLAQFRYLGKGPRFVKVGKAVRYRWSDVEAYLDEQTFAQTGGVR